MRGLRGTPLDPLMLLSGQERKRVQSVDGRRIGRLLDLTISVGSNNPIVQRLLVSAGHGQAVLVPWAAVVRFDPAGVAIDPAIAEAPFRTDADLKPHELLLHRDVLDTQVFDATNHRMTRVADVLLGRTPDGRLQLMALDVGMRAILRRLRMGWLGNRFPEDAVNWDDIHLTSDRGHELLVANETAAVHRLTPDGLAQLITRLGLHDAHDIIRRVNPERAKLAVSLTHPAVRRRLEPALHPPQTSSGRLPRREIFGRHQGWRHNLPRSGTDA